jgi:DNA-binding MarR family transcriptional regulator
LYRSTIGVQLLVATKWEASVITAATANELLDVFRAIVRASRVARSVPEPDEMPGWQVAVLALLAREGEQRLGRVAVHLEVDPSVASRQVAALEEHGLVTRRPDPADGRAQLLGVSAAGRAALDDYRDLRARWFAQALDGWDDAEVAHLAARMQQLVGDLHEALAERTRPAPGVARQAS